MSALVVVLGSVNVDYVATVPRLPTAGETVGDGTLHIHQGGKGANQAVAARRFGAPTQLVAVIGQDAVGTAALDALIVEGVDVSLVRRGDALTGAALIMVGPDGANMIAVMPGANREASARDVVRALEGEPGIFVTGFEVRPEDAATAALRAMELGWHAIINPAPASPLPPDLQGSGVTLVPNETELASITGQRDHVLGLADLAEWSGGPVIVTMGERGAAVRDGGRTQHLAAPRVEVRDTTGAGDAFIGGLAGALADGHGLLEAARYGIALASASVIGSGARAHVPSRMELDDLVQAGSGRS